MPNISFIAPRWAHHRLCEPKMCASNGLNPPFLFLKRSWRRSLSDPTTSHQRWLVTGFQRNIASTGNNGYIKHKLHPPFSLMLFVSGLRPRSRAFEDTLDLLVSELHFHLLHYLENKTSALPMQFLDCITRDNRTNTSLTTVRYAYLKGKRLLFRSI